MSLPMSMNNRSAREAATLARLSEANRSERAVLSGLVLSALNDIADETDGLSNDLVALLGPKAEALPDTVVMLYLREVPAFTARNLVRHMKPFSTKEQRRSWLRTMGLGNISLNQMVPRPRVFPRAMLAADLNHMRLRSDNRKGGSATANRALQFLSEVGLTREYTGSSGAKDTKVQRKLLELVEESVAAMPSVKETKGHPWAIGGFAKATAIAMIVGIGASTADLAHGETAGSFYVETNYVAFKMEGATIASADFTDPASIPSQSQPSAAIYLASLDDVLLGSRKLLGPTPIPQPVEPLQLWTGDLKWRVAVH